MTIQVLDERASRSSATGFAYDVFVVHAAADEWFVRAYLLDKLGLSPERVLMPMALELGKFLVGEIERGVRSSRVTIAVLSFAYMDDHWAESKGRAQPFERTYSAVIRRADRLLREHREGRPRRAATALAAGL